MKSSDFFSSDMSGSYVIPDVSSAAAILNRIHDGVFLSDAEGKLIFWNREMERITGYPAEAFIGKYLWDVHAELLPTGPLSADELNLVKQKIRNVLRSGRTTWSKTIELPLKRKDGRVVRLQAYDFSVPAGDGYAVGSVLRELDMEAIDAYADFSRELLAAKELMLKEANHRIKNNLSIISSIIGLQAAGTEEGDPIREILNGIQNRIAGIALIHDLLYKSDSSDFVRLDQYLNSIISLLHRSFGSDTLSITSELEELSVECDKALLYGLILNELISNTLKHASRPGTPAGIFVKLGREGPPRAKSLVFSVRDSGPGIRNPDGFSGGKSLGISLIRSLSRQLGGEPDFSSDSGTVFTLRTEWIERV